MTDAQRPASSETPGPYGWNATPEQIDAVQANIAAMEAQRARRRAEHAARMAAKKADR